MDLIISKGKSREIIPIYKEIKNVFSAYSTKGTSENNALDIQTSFNKKLKQFESQIGNDGLLLLASFKDCSIAARRAVITNELKTKTRKNIFLNDEDAKKFSRIALNLIVDNIDNEKGIPHILRLFNEFSEKKVVDVKNNMGQVTNSLLVNNRINNNRTYNLMFDYLNTEDTLTEFRAIKYRTKLRIAYRHILGKHKFGLASKLFKELIETNPVQKTESIAILNKMFNTEINYQIFPVLYRFIIGDLDESELTNSLHYGFPVMKKYYALKKVNSIDDLKKINNLPKEIYIGILSDNKHPLYHELFDEVDNLVKSGKISNKKPKKFVLKNEYKTLILELSKNAMTADVQQRSTKLFKDAGVKKTRTEAEVKDVNALLKTGYETGKTKKITEAIKEKAKENKITLPYDDILLVVDKSQSMLGDQNESKNTPRAVADFSVVVFQESFPNLKVVYSDGDIAESIINGLYAVKVPDAVFIISDGFETAYDGKVGELLSILGTDLKFGNIDFFHINPVVTGDGDLKIKTFSGATGMFPLGVRNPLEITAKINLNKLELNPTLFFEDEFNKIFSLTE